MSNTIAQLPWTPKQFTNSPGCALLDASGNTIGLFNDYRNAEYFIGSINDYMRLHDSEELLAEKVMELELNVIALELQLEKQKKQNEQHIHPAK